MNEIAKVLTLSRRAMELLDEELDRHRRGKDIVGTVAQLATCQRHLREMIAQLESNRLPPKNQRLGGMGHMIADSWPVNSKLGEALLRAEQAYRNASS